MLYESFSCVYQKKRHQNTFTHLYGVAGASHTVSVFRFILIVYEQFEQCV